MTLALSNCSSSRDQIRYYMGRRLLECSREDRGEREMPRSLAQRRGQKRSHWGFASMLTSTRRNTIDIYTFPIGHGAIPGQPRFVVMFRDPRSAKRNRENVFFPWSNYITSIKHVGLGCDRRLNSKPSWTASGGLVWGLHM